MALRRLTKRPPNGLRGWERNGGKTERSKRRDPSPGGEGGGSQSLHNTEAVFFLSGERGGQQNRSEGREAGSWRREVRQTQDAVSGVPARATQGTEARASKWWWAEASIWTERMVSALGNGVKGGKWFSLVDKVIALKTLEAAWRKVERNKGSSGIDGQSIERFAAGAERYLTELHQALKDGGYRPAPIKRVDIPKGGGQTRPLGIPTVKDRIVQTALKMAIEPIFETTFRDGSYGFRPGRSCKDALREVDRLVKEGYAYVVDADLRSYFDSIPRDGLLARVAEKISDGRVLELIEGYLHQDVMKGMERWTPTTGTPQGAVISPLLANIYLHPLDLLMEQSGYRMVRYADDGAPRRREEEVLM
jgi:RNA-directed DNA polymerase